MDQLSNFRTNLHFDSIINQIVDHELTYEDVMRNLVNNENQSRIDQPNEYFINYFLNSLHLSSYWIINGNNSINRSVQNSPIKLDAKVSSNQIKTPIKDATKLEVKRNLFDTKILESRALDAVGSKFDSSKFDSRFFKSPPLNQQKNLNLNDDELFPKLNTQFIKTTPNSAERKLNQPIQLTSTLNSQPKSNKKQRRINPTSLTTSDNKNCLRKTLFNEPPEKEQKDNSREDIKRMTKDISILTPKKTTLTNIQSLVKTPIKNQEQLPPIQSSLDKITINKTKFLNLIQFYSKLIEHNLVPNILVELDFLLQLITRRITIEKTTEYLNSFSFCSNYHNCIYFAVKSLELLYEPVLVNIFDEQFFKTLSLNESIRQFSLDFQQKLLNSKELETEEEQIQDLSTIIPSLDFIAYQPETDSIENFTNDNSFHVFRKQRDAFFRLYYEWKQLYAKKCFKQESIINDQEFKFTQKVSFIFNLSKDFANYFHFARIFLAQLLQCCVGTNQEQLISDLIKEQTNQSTSNVNENKMKKLNKRFNQPDQKVLATQSSFTGEEIFFYEFIICCNNYNFLTILQNHLTSKITELNSPNLLMDQIDLDENNMEIAANFCTNLLNLQLLAKFLGLIVFMPFYSKQTNSANQVNSKNLNNLNELIKNYHTQESSLCKSINQMVKNSIRGKYLILTLPWIIQFLNQMDLQTSQFTNYDQTIYILVDIYHELGFKVADYEMNKMNFVYLNLVFGNFFEKYFLICAGKLFEFKQSQLLNYLNDLSSDKTLDGFQLINKKFLNACFPKLFIMKEVIKQNTIQSNEIRKTIKPLTLNTPLNDNLTTTPAKLLIDKKNLIQIEYEENFFRLHSDSLRKTVEFIADRLHSKCIKCLRYEQIKKVKTQVFLRHENLSKTMVILDEIKEECLKFIRQFSEPKINSTIDLMISEYDFSSNTVAVAKSITFRILIDKCLNWFANNLNDLWIMNETLVENDLRKQTKPKSSNQEASSSAIEIPNISNCFNRVRDLICDLLFSNQLNCSKDELINLIKELIRLRNAKLYKLNSRTNQVIETTIVDLITTLVTFQPLIMDSELIQLFISFYLENKLTVTKFISPRNLYILSLSKETYKTWDKYESIIIRLTQKEIYEIQQLEDDVLCVLNNQNEWNENLLRKLASCIKSAVEVFKSNEKYKNYSENIELVDWLSWFCGQQSEFE